MEVIGEDEYKDPTNISNQSYPYLREQQIIRNELRKELRDNINKLK